MHLNVRFKGSQTHRFPPSKHRHHVTDHANAIEEIALADVPGNQNSVQGNKKDFATQTGWPTEACTDDTKISARCADVSPHDVVVSRCLCVEGGKRCMWPPVNKTLRCIQCTDYCSYACYGCDPHTSDSEVDEPYGNKWFHRKRSMKKSARSARTRTKIHENGTPGRKQKMLTMVIMSALLVCQILCAIQFGATTSTGPSPLLDTDQIMTETTQINLDNIQPPASET